MTTHDPMIDDDDPREYDPREYDPTRDQRQLAEAIWFGAWRSEADPGDPRWPR
jgi:hypothetical protein